MTQRWTSFGHAMWRCEVDGLSMLIDPVCSPTHHDGVFGVHPPRTFDLDALDDPILVITHRHLDHFDLPTLIALAARRADRLVLTADALVAEVCARVGFRWAKVLPPLSPAPLGPTATLIPTPSLPNPKEWGMLVRSPGAAVWNQVDSDPGGPDAVRRLLGDATEAGLDLLIGRWCPIDQLLTLHGGGATFPLQAWRAELERVAAADARCVVPGAASTRYDPPEHWLNRFAYPVSEAEAVEAIAIRCPRATVSPLVVGRRFTVAEGAVTWDDPPGPVTAGSAPDPRAWRPLDPQPLVDDADPDPTRADRLTAWVRDALTPALAAWRWERPARLQLELLDGHDRLTWRFTLPADPAAAVQVDRGADDRWDALVAVTGGALDAVLRGDAPWGRALLSGRLRALQRGWRATPTGVRALKLPAIFLYLALPYEVAYRRWFERQLAARGLDGRPLPP